MNFIVYDKNGKIIRTGGCPASMLSVQAQNGEFVVEGKANDTLKKFRHTISASQRLEKHTVELADIFEESTAQKARFNLLASQQITPKFIDQFLENLSPTQDKVKRGLTMATNRQDAIKELYEGKADLTDLPNTKYRLLNAITDYADHEMTVKNGDDEGKRYWNIIQGSSHKLKQQAFEMLLA